MKKILALLILTIMIFAGCSKNNRVIPIEQRMAKADEYYEKGKFSKAIPLYEEVVFERSSKLTAKAQTRLADCHFQREDYVDAEYEYKEMIRLFPDYPSIGESYFRLAESIFNQSLKAHYTQEETTRAIEAYQDFYQRFNEADKRKLAIEKIQECQLKLIEKKYHNGYIYFKTYDFSAALMYFDEIMELGNDNEWDMMSNYYAVRIYSYRKNQVDADLALDRLVKRYPDNKITKKAQRYYKKMFSK